MRPAITTIVHFASRIGLSVVGFLSTLYFANVLGASVLGSYFVFVALLAWLNIPATAISSAVTKRVSEGVDEPGFLSAGFVLNALIAVVLAVAILAAEPWVDRYVGAESGELLAVLVVGQIAFWTVVYGLRGQKKVAESGVLEVVDRVLRVGSQVGLVLLGFGVVGLVAGHAVAFLAAAAVGLAIFEVRPAMPRREHFRELLSYAAYSWLGWIKTRTFAWMDIVVLRFLQVSTALIGVYEVSWGIASVLALVSNSIQHTLFPEMSELTVDDEDDGYDEVHTLLSDALVFGGVFVIPGFFGAALLAPDLLRLYGAEFVRGGTVLLVLIVARGIAAYESILINTINAIDHPDVAYRVNLVFIVANLVLNLGLVSLYGWIGAAVGTAISSGLALALSFRYLDRLIGRPDLPLAEIGKQVLAGGVMAAFVAAADAVLPWDGAVTTVGLVFFGAGVYGLVLLAVSTRIRTKAISLAPDRMKRALGVDA